MNEEFDFLNINQYREEIDREAQEDPGDDCKDLSPADQWEIWKELQGSRHVLRQAYRFTSHYAQQYRRTGQRVSVKLIWELVRHHVKTVRARALRAGVDIKDWQGYKLNNIFTPYLARHIIDHRPDWDGMFEMRATKH